MEWAEGLQAITLDDSDDDSRAAKKERRNRRMREALLHARETYTAKIDSDAWFCEGLSLDSVDTMEVNSRTTQRVQAVILFLYYRQEFLQAFTWSCALLRRLSVLGTEKVWQNHGRPIFPVPEASDKASLSTSNSAVARETLDTALRCVLHCDIPLSEAEPLLAAGFQKARLPDADYAALYQDGHVNHALQKACAWTHNPGLCVSLGDACHHLRLYALAVEAYALAAGARGAPWRICVRIVRALDGLVKDTTSSSSQVLGVLARVCATCAIMACPMRDRHGLWQELHTYDSLMDAVHEPVEAKDWDPLAILALPPVLPRETYLVLFYALGRRGDLQDLAQQLVPIMQSPGGSADALAPVEDEPADRASRSVRTL
ncbi:hypothetical protein MNAN1_000933 [Malassezia nana]|uniref:Uncharacterized protein n=1 Tax=Malassezia nana TaxID=180528 RepID=A0AAF0J6E7_9BASI|nr:hypothetical protein MNAN1_000933 [Malassezia nana]